MRKEDDKDRAKRLRREGRSFREISERLAVSKSTASLWTRGEYLDIKAKSRLKELGDRGREKANETARRRNIERISLIERNCSVLIGKNYGVDEYKVVLAALYWGEGNKAGKRLDFVNSDPDMMHLYLSLLRRCFCINESRLKPRIHLHEYHDREEMVDFWSKVTAIPKSQFSVYNKPHTGLSKKLGYKGCLSLRYGDSRIFNEISIIIKRLHNL